MKKIFVLLMVFCMQMAYQSAQAQSNQKYWKYAPRPVLGWNSWDIFGTTVTEQQAKEQADAMARYLLPSGYKYFTVDIQWYEPNSKGHSYKKRCQAHYG